MGSMCYVYMCILYKVFRTPNSTKLLSILHKMLLIERDTATSDITWNGLEAMTDAALKIYSDQQAQRIATSGRVAYDTLPRLVVLCINE